MFCLSLDWGGKERLDLRPGPGQIGMGCLGNSWGRTVQVSSVEMWLSGPVKIEANMFCDTVSRGIEKKVSLKFRLEN